MIAEEHLVGILNAADPDDCDDVAIRTLLAAALKESDIDFSAFTGRSMFDDTRSCELRAARRAGSSTYAERQGCRRRRGLDHRSLTHRTR